MRFFNVTICIIILVLLASNRSFGQNEIVKPNRVSKDSVLNLSLIKFKFIELNNSHEGLQKPTIDLRFNFYIKAHPISNHYTDGRYLFDVEGPYQAPYSVQNQHIVQFRRKDD